MSVRFPESLSLASILLGDACTTRKDSELEWLAKDHPETNPITIKPNIASHVAEQFSWVPLPYCSPPGCPFPVKSLPLSAHVSPRTIHFRVLDKSPVSGLERVCLPATHFLKINLPYLCRGVSQLYSLPLIYGSIPLPLPGCCVVTKSCSTLLWL